MLAFERSRFFFLSYIYIFEDFIKFFWSYVIFQFYVIFLKRKFKGTFDLGRESKMGCLFFFFICIFLEVDFCYIRNF